jgi:integrase/recombinase XerD
VRNYEFVFSRFGSFFGDIELEAINSEGIISFLSKINAGTRQSTKKLRYSLLSAFFNFLKSSIDSQLDNPCDSPVLKNAFRAAKSVEWKILDKDLVDEIIFRTVNERNRLLLELMARGGMRIGEVLKMTPGDIEDQKISLSEPKSGRQNEVVFIPQKVAERLKTYIKDKAIQPHQQIFPITYAAARVVVKKAGNPLGVNLRPHDLRRHAATFASRAGTPLEIVGKVILRHANLSTTQRYLGKVSDLEAIRWIESLYGK